MVTLPLPIKSSSCSTISHCRYYSTRMKEFNKAMSSVLISVEWLFGDIVNYFKFVDFKKTQKISLSALG